jgi:hypothetical protein
MMKTFRYNDAWYAMQQGVAMNASRIASETNAAVSKITHDAGVANNAVHDELSRRRSNAILGVEDVLDTATGRVLKVESGSSYVWLDPRGNVVGTETHTKPAPEFAELARLP